MRQFISIFTALVLVFGVVACDETPSSPSANTAAASSQITVTYNYDHTDHDSTFAVGGAEIIWEHCEKSSSEIAYSDCHKHIKNLTESGSSALTCDTGDSNDDRYEVLAVDAEEGRIDMAREGVGGKLGGAAGPWTEDECPIDKTFNVSNDTLATSYDEMHTFVQNIGADAGNEVSSGNRVGVLVDDATDTENNCNIQDAKGCYFSSTDSIYLSGDDNTQASTAAEEYAHRHQFKGNYYFQNRTTENTYGFAASEGQADFLVWRYGSSRASTDSDVQSVTHGKPHCGDSDDADQTPANGQFFYDLWDSDSDNDCNESSTFDDDGVSISAETIIDAGKGCEVDVDGDGTFQRMFGPDHYVWCLTDRINSNSYNSFWDDHSEPVDVKDGGSPDASDSNSAIDEVWKFDLYGNDVS